MDYSLPILCKWLGVRGHLCRIPGGSFPSPCFFVVLQFAQLAELRQPLRAIVYMRDIRFAKTEALVCLVVRRPEVGEVTFVYVKENTLWSTVQVREFAIDWYSRKR